MARVLIPVAAISLLLSLAAAAPVPKHLNDPVYYFPTKVGTEWVYSNELVDEHGGTRYRRSFCAVKTVRRKGDSWLVTTKSREEEGLLDREEVLLVSDGCLTLIEHDGTECDPPVCLLKQPHMHGVMWEERSEFVKMAIHTKYAIQDSEDVIAPAGRFRAIPVKQDGRIVESRKDGWSWTHWYAVGVGVVKAKSSGGTTIALKSFTPGKD